MLVTLPRSRPGCCGMSLHEFATPTATAVSPPMKNNQARCDSNTRPRDDEWRRWRYVGCGRSAVMRYCRVRAGCGWSEFRRAEVILLTFFLTTRRPPSPQRRRLVPARCQFVRGGSLFHARCSRLVLAMPVWCVPVSIRQFVAFDRLHPGIELIEVVLQILEQRETFFLKPAQSPPPPPAIQPLAAF